MNTFYSGRCRSLRSLTEIRQPRRNELYMMVSSLYIYFLLQFIIMTSEGFLRPLFIPRNAVFLFGVPSRKTRPLFSQNADENEVSDAEALLACYIYLRRRKRVGNWEQQERRQRMKAAAPPHFFLEEDLSRIAARLNREKHDTMEDDDELEEEESDEARLRPSRNGAAAERWSGEFTSFPVEPSPTRARRSQAAKRTWTDPGFRKRWYEKRWAARVGQEKPETLEEKKLEQQVRALPSGFLGSGALSDMTEDEIQDAIQSYLNTRRKRVESRKKTLFERKAMLHQQMKDAMTQTTRTPTVKSSLSPDSLGTIENNALKEAQRRRSERAKVLYQKRLQNEKEKKELVDSPATKRPTTIKYFPSSATPQDSMIRIIHDLDSGVLPALQDVEIIMKPGKIAKRRQILRRIVADCFDLRGRCVPVKGSKDELEFVTNCAIDDLGAFVIELLNQRTRVEGAPGLKGSSTTTDETAALPTRTSSGLLAVAPEHVEAQNSTIPQDALLRIKQALDGGVTPSVTDVRLILQSKRTAGRKQILGRILSDCFDLKGKCVPNGMGQMDFISRSTLDEVGSHVLGLLENL